MNEGLDAYLAKANESLAGAKSELANGRVNKTGNRVYYTVFQAAVAALIHAGVRRPAWYHEDVQALFSGEMTHRRKLYPAELRDLIYELYEIRIVSDYREIPASRVRVERAIRRAEAFVKAVQERTT
jgi:uncharacterized protein (UPF0332 family)